MGKNETIQIKADEDDCIYLFDVDTKKWQKLCDVKAPKELPDSVKLKIAEMQRATI